MKFLQPELVSETWALSPPFQSTFLEPRRHKKRLKKKKKKLIEKTCFGGWSDVLDQNCAISDMNFSKCSRFPSFLVFCFLMNISESIRNTAGRK